MGEGDGWGFAGDFDGDWWIPGCTDNAASGDDRSGFMGEIGGLKNETAKETTSSKYAFHSIFLKVN
jgi:hypothetical protein